MGTGRKLYNPPTPDHTESESPLLPSECLWRAALVGLVHPGGGQRGRGRGWAEKSPGGTHLDVVAHL